jgi:hypothetical protein
MWYVRLHHLNVDALTQYSKAHVTDITNRTTQQMASSAVTTAAAVLHVNRRALDSSPHDAAACVQRVNKCNVLNRVSIHAK